MGKAQVADNEFDVTVTSKGRMTLDDIAGSLSRKYSGLSFTQEDIDAAINLAVTEKWERAAKPLGRARAGNSFNGGEC